MRPKRSSALSLESGTVSVGLQIQSTEKEKGLPGGRNSRHLNIARSTTRNATKTENPVQKTNEKKRNDTTNDTRSDSMASAQNEPEEIKNTPLPSNESITRKTEIISEPSSLPPDAGETQQSGSTALSLRLSGETLASMNLLRDTGKHLYELMLGLHKNQPSVEAKLYDPERVKAAAECGKQIISTMRMQLDILKFAKELK
jgi:hypothetical protein